VFKLSTKGRYGVRLMLDLALNYGKGPVALKDVAKRQEISGKYLEHLITPLKKGKLIRSSRGAGGGYVLTRDPGSISLQEIIALVEGPMCIAECTKDSKICKRSQGCLSRGVWKELADKISETLTEMTLKKIIEKNFHSGEELCYDI
jgi:Rrf2 family transcriptional regulator, cysteine metabolism repressor